MDDRNGHARNDAMVSTLVRRGLVSAGQVEGAFRAVARHRFLPGLDLDRVYDAEAAIPTKREPDGEITSSSSAPAIMGLMLGGLAVEPSHRVLEIGAGTGYNAALLATLAGPRGSVTSIDLAPDVAASAAANLAANGFVTVDVRAGDGWLGAADRAPFDRIIVTVGVPDLSPQWLAQLAPSGRLVAPLWLADNVDVAVAFVRDGDRLRSVSLHRCGFMRLRGPHAADEWIGLGDGWSMIGPPSGPVVDAMARLHPMLRDAGPAPPAPPGWQIDLALSGATVATWVYAADGNARHRVGLVALGAPWEPAGFETGGKTDGVVKQQDDQPSLAMLEGGRLLVAGGPSAERRLRARLGAAVPVSLRQLEVQAVPTAAFGVTPVADATWVVARPSFTFVVRRR